MKIKELFLLKTIKFFELEITFNSSFLSSILLNIVYLVIIALKVAKIVEFSIGSPYLEYIGFPPSVIIKKCLFFWKNSSNCISLFNFVLLIIF